MNIKTTYLLLAATLLVVGCEDSAAPSAGAGHQHPELTTGEELFNLHCSPCHGTKGWGNFLKGMPAAAATEMSAGGIAHKVRTRRSPDDPLQMPVFDDMSAQEATKIANYVLELHARSLEKH